MGARSERFGYDVGTTVLGAVLLGGALVLELTSTGMLGLGVFGALTLLGGLTKLARPDFIEVDIAVLVVGLWCLLAPWVIVVGSPTAEWIVKGMGIALVLVSLPGTITRFTWVDAPYPHHSSEEEGEAADRAKAVGG